MSDALDEHDEKVSIDDRNITNLRFADVIDGLAEELEVLVESLDKTYTRYKTILTRKSGVLGSIPGLATYFRFSFRFFKKGRCQLLAKVCARSTG